MLDTSYGFNNLLKEVTILLSRDTNTSQASNKLFLKTLQLANKSALKSKDHLVLMVSLPLKNGSLSILFFILSSLYPSIEENGR